MKEPLMPDERMQRRSQLREVESVVVKWTGNGWGVLLHYGSGPDDQWHAGRMFHDAVSIARDMAVSHQVDVVIKTRPGRISAHGRIPE